MRKLIIAAAILIIIVGSGFIIKTEISRVKIKSTKTIKTLLEKECEDLTQSKWSCEIRVNPEQVKLSLSDAIKIVLNKPGYIEVTDAQINLKNPPKGTLTTKIKKAVFKIFHNRVIPQRFEHITGTGNLVKNTVFINYDIKSISINSQTKDSMRLGKLNLSQLEMNLISKKLPNTMKSVLEITMVLPSLTSSFSYPALKKEDQIIDYLSNLKPKSVVTSMQTEMPEMKIDIKFLNKKMQKEEFGINLKKLIYQSSLTKEENEKYTYRLKSSQTLKNISLKNHNERTANIEKLIPIFSQLEIGINNITDNIIYSLISLRNILKNMKTGSDLSKFFTTLSMLITELKINPPYITIKFNINPNNIFNVDFKSDIQIKNLSAIEFSGDYKIEKCHQFKKYMKEIFKIDLNKLKIKENNICSGNFKKTEYLGNVRFLH